MFELKQRQNAKKGFFITSKIQTKNKQTNKAQLTGCIWSRLVHSCLTSGSGTDDSHRLAGGESRQRAADLLLPVGQGDVLHGRRRGQVEDTGRLAQLLGGALGVGAGREGGQDVLHLRDGLAPGRHQRGGGEELGLEQGYRQGAVGVAVWRRDGGGGSECLVLGGLRLGGGADELHGRLSRQCPTEHQVGHYASGASGHRVGRGRGEVAPAPCGSASRANQELRLLLLGSQRLPVGRMRAGRHAALPGFGGDGQRRADDRPHDVGDHGGRHPHWVQAQRRGCRP